MNRTHVRRTGLTLIELLVIVAVIAVLLGLTVSGVMQVREASLRAESQNNLRQIVLALHQYADAKNGRLPMAPVSERRGRTIFPVESVPSVHVSILPYCEQGAVYRELRKRKFDAPISLFLSPADPTAREGVSKGMGLASYAANAQVFRHRPRVSTTFVDGTSYTITFAEHYSYNCNGYSFSYWFNMPPSIPDHRATFADVSDLSPGKTGLPNFPPGKPLLTFQVAPSPNKCMPLVAQTPHRSGMLVAMGDGSVRTLAPGMSATTYWAAVTPAGSEVLGADW